MLRCLPESLSERILITTADERSWNLECPVVFLGEWCRRLDREQAWSRLDAVVARPVQFDGAERERVIAYVDALSRGLLLELARHLNRLHGSRRSLRFWRVLLGHWIHRYTCLLFHRWNAVKQVLAEHRISNTIVFGAPVALAGHDTKALIWASNEDSWNNVLIGRVLEELAPGSIEHRALEMVGSSTVPSASAHGNVTATAARYLPRVIDSALAIFQRETDSFVISSYLPPLQSMLLSMRLGAPPRLRRSPEVQPVAVNAALRAANGLSAGSHEAFVAFARRMLLELLPTCFLEGFDALQKQVAQLEWPSRPRLIFTSNSFDTGEVFKLWAAEKMEAGCPYIIGQHGSNYGTASYCPSETECVETADAFITWGWRGDKPNCRPAFLFKTAGRSSPRWDRLGGLLLIEAVLPHLMSAWDPYPEFAVYQQDQFRFVECLPEEIQQCLTVRLHADHKRMAWGEQRRWHRREGAVRLENGTTPLAALMRRSRLVVHSYDSTGILENLALNIPTLCFWREGTGHLRASAVPFYRLLADSEILHETAEGAARKVTQVWSDVGGWWHSAAVQDARRRFCDQYARSSDTPIETLARLLLEIRPVNGTQGDVADLDTSK